MTRALENLVEKAATASLRADAVEIGALDVFAQAVMEAEQELRSRQKG